MAHAHCMLDKYGYRHTLTICNTYSISTTTVVARTLPGVMLYVRCLLENYSEIKNSAPLFNLNFTWWLIFSKH